MQTKLYEVFCILSKITFHKCRVSQFFNICNLLLSFSRPSRTTKKIKLKRLSLSKNVFCVRCLFYMLNLFYFFYLKLYWVESNNYFNFKILLDMYFNMFFYQFIRIWLMPIFINLLVVHYFALDQNIGHIIRECPKRKFGGKLEDIFNVTSEVIKWIKAYTSTYNFSTLYITKSVSLTI